MALSSWLYHQAGNVVAPVSKAVGSAVDLVAPEGSSLDKTGGLLYNVGSDINNPNVRYNGGLIDGANSFGEPAQVANPNAGIFVNGQRVAGGQASAGGQDTGSSIGQNGGSTIDWNAISNAQSIIDQYNSGLARLGGQQQTGLDNITNEYTKQYNSLNDRKAIDERDYTTKKTQTQQDQLNAKNQISAGVRNKSNSMQRLLGSFGAGSSAASEMLVPFLAAKMGTSQREQVNQTYGRNLGSLDTAWGDTSRSYKSAFDDLETQKTTQENAYKAQILQQQADYQSKITEQQAAQEYARTGNAAAARSIIAAGQNSVNNIYAQIDALAKQAPTYKIADFKYDAPNLEQYNYERADLPTGGNTLPAGVSPSFWGYFNQDKEKDQTNPIA